MTVAKGDRFGDWIVEGSLGEGGMGSVYRCHSVLADDVRAAVKVLKRGQAVESKERFVQELRTLSSLHHPAIVRVLGGGRDDQHGFVYMAMELIEGRDLSDRLAAGPLTSDEAVAIFGPVADALSYAHQRGVAHRDIKPSNIMLRADGSPVIVDFGIAIAEGRTRHTKEGLVPGTVVYMPPEIFEGNKPDPKSSDAYGLGVVMWESLTGKAPFDADPSSGEGAMLAQVMGQKLRSDALDPGASVPKHLREAVRRTTDPSPVTRLVDLAAVRDLLTTGKTAVPLKRRRSGCALALGALVIVGAGVAIGATIVAVGAGAWWAARSGEEPPRPTVDLAATLEEAARALEGGDVAAARQAAGLALDDHADDPHANLLYGQTLLAGGEGLLAQPYLCAAVDGGLGARVPGHTSGDLVCDRGPGSATPLVAPLALAHIDLSAAIAAASALREGEPAVADASDEGRTESGGSGARPRSSGSRPAPPSTSSPAPASSPVVGLSAESFEPPGAPSAGAPPSEDPPPPPAQASPARPADSPAEPPKRDAGDAKTEPEADDAVAPRAVVSFSVGGRRADLPGDARRAVEVCYVDALASAPRTSGRIEIELVIGDFGSVVGATVASDAIGDDGLSTCVRTALRSAVLSQDWSRTTVRLAISFSPG